MHGLWGDSWVGLKLSGQDLRTWLLYHHQAIACCGTDCSSICFVWLIATLKVITSGTKRPCELQKPLPIARLWLFNISVRANEIFRVGCWALYQEHTRDYAIREVYTAMTTERQNEIWKHRRESKKSRHAFRFTARFGWLMALLVSVSFWKRSEGSFYLETWIQPTVNCFTEFTDNKESVVFKWRCKDVGENDFVTNKTFHGAEEGQQLFCVFAFRAWQEQHNW